MIRCHPNRPDPKRLVGQMPCQTADLNAEGLAALERVEGLLHARGRRLTCCTREGGARAVGERARLWCR